MRKWNREIVVAAIQKRHKDGLSLFWCDVERDDYLLTKNAHRYCDGWREALRLAGIILKKRNRRGCWSRKRVIREILDRARDGLGLSNISVRCENRSLATAAIRYCGGWSQALIMAGIDPEKVTLQHRWSPEKIVQHIQTRAIRKQPLNVSALSDSGGIVSAAIRKFGSWDAALKAAGFDPVLIRKRPRPCTRDELLNEIRSLKECGIPRKRTAATSRLFRRAVRLFGSWSRACLTAGVQPQNRYCDWTSSMVIAGIHERSLKGLDLYCVAVAEEDSALLGAACKRFGKWSVALQAAGFDPATIRKHLPKWTMLSIRDAILCMQRENKPLNSGWIRPKSLVAAASRLFGSWEHALRFSGLNPDHHKTRRKPWTRSKLIIAIRNAAVALRNGQRVDRRIFRKPAKRLCGSWNIALRIAGVSLNEFL